MASLLCSMGGLSCEDGTMPPSTRRSTAALRHRDFALFWSASLVSNSGTWLQNVAVRGHSFTSTLPNLGALAIFAAVLAGLALRLFRWQTVT